MEDNVTVGPWAALRELHSPYLGSYEVRCSGCPGDMEYGDPDWPCASADLLYTPGEIAELTASFTPEIEAYREAQRQLRQHTLDHGSPSEKAMLKVADEMLRWALQPVQYYTNFAPKEVPDA